MGGFGSGEHNAWNARRTVEECDSLDINWLTREGIFDCPNHNTGKLWMSRPRNEEVQVDYRLELASRRMRLFNQFDDEQIEYCIPLEKRELPWGKFRWWFRCPLVIDNKPCLSRVAKLWRPPYSKWFACRQCHNLTYRISQEFGGSRRSATTACILPWQDVVEYIQFHKKLDHDLERAAQRRARRKQKGWS